MLQPSSAPYAQNKAAFSGEISMGVTGGPGATLNNISKFGEAPAVAANGPVSCFVIENESFIEVRDCCIKSVKDKSNFDAELDNHLGASQSRANLAKSGHEQTVTQDASIKHEFMEYMRKQDNEINDVCFSLNQRESQAHPTIDNYSGLVSLCSTTIYNFMNGVYCGQDAILTCE